ncbi:MAG: TIGR01440 family protein [Clostridiaceae bacterium]|jgi:uncharacterized protein (TIGR01440 family)|nr:TIGR01440 family protein [Clostridiaceae bacterium]
MNVIDDPIVQDSRSGETAIRTALQNACKELIAEAAYSCEGDLFVLGCSTSEILGIRIGQGSSMATGELVIDAVLPLIEKHGFHLAVQCCEHLNRALVVERDIMIRDRLEEVNAVPALHAGGACALAAYNRFQNPVLVEHLQGTMGLDIGDTFIGMHIRFVQRPLRLKEKSIGHAHLTALMYRPKLIGGDRAKHF